MGLPGSLFNFCLALSKPAAAKPAAEKQGLSISLDVLRSVRLRSISAVEGSEAAKEPAARPRSGVALPGLSLADLTNVRLKKAAVREQPAQQKPVINAASPVGTGVAARTSALRKVDQQRSPGGTPVRRKENIVPSRMSQTSDFTTALQQRFKHARSTPTGQPSPTTSPF